VRSHRIDQSAVDLSARLPLVIGITGHRDLRDEDIRALEAKVREILQEIRARYLHTPLILLSPLADGADRLAARVAIALGVRLIVPLPMTPELYLQDFSTPASRAEFEALLQQAEATLVLPLVAGNTLAGIQESVEQRDRQYALVGAYVADRCQILIALWDGVPTAAEGGTSGIVGFKLEGIPLVYAPPHERRSRLDTPENGPVYQIVTPRKSNPETDGAPFALRKRFPQTAGSTEPAKVFDRIFGCIDSFNRDASEVAPRLAEDLKKSKTSLLPDLDPDTLPAELKSLLESYAVATTLANHFQRLTLRALTCLVIAIPLLAFVFNLYNNLFPNYHLLLAFYVIGLGVAYRQLYRRADRGEYHRKFLDYRALAEGLRVQFFWRLAGLRDLVADHYLSKQRSELDWIRSALQFWRSHADLEAPDAVPDAAWSRRERIDLVLRCWVEHQRHFFADRSEREQRRLERLQRWVPRMLGLGVAAALLAVVLLAPLWVMDHFSVPKPWLWKWLKQGASYDLWLDKLSRYQLVYGLLMTGIGFPSIFGGVLQLYVDRRGLSEHAKQYARMHVLFDNAGKQLSAVPEAGVYPEARALLLELGKEALDENGDWVMFHRQRPLEPPGPGG
jgi:hypothetical protein